VTYRTPEGDENLYRILIGKREGMRLLGRTFCW